MIYKYNLGARFAGPLFYLGTIILLVSAFVFFQTDSLELKLVLLITALIGLTIAPVFKGVHLDTQKNTATKYVSVFLFKWKEVQYPLDHFKKLQLTIYKDAQIMRMKSQQSLISTKSYDIYLLSENQDKLIIAEFTDYKKAVEFLNKSSSTLGLPAEDLYEKLKNKASRSRKR